MSSKKLLKFFLTFSFFFLCLIFFFNINKGDLYVNYGFSYALSKLEIPYKDFNLVITPFAPVLYSLGLFISKSIIVYYLEQALLLTLLFVLLEKLLKTKAYLFLTIMLLPFPISFSTTIFPGYNFLAFFLLILLIYLEKNNYNDYLSGLILGLLFCTKQTIGLCLFLPNLIYLFQKPKKFLKRVVAYLIPISILLVSLLLTSSLKPFINLCFLGLLNFGESNKAHDSFYTLLLILGLLYITFKIIKKPHYLVNYYILFFVVISLPIIDYYHVSLFLLGVLYLFLEDYHLASLNISKYCLTFTIVISLVWFGISLKYLHSPRLVNYPNFPLTLVSNSYHQDVSKLTTYLKTKKQSKIYLLRGSENYFFKIMANEKLDYFDLPNHGNYGYNGINMMVSKLKNEHNVLFILDKSLLEDNNKYQQYIKEFIPTVQHDSKLIKTIGLYEVYFKE